ncbi:MAG: hypothetical protein IH587_05505, partial [Anaerolineae bacterium]|nr:hypothetical protein [Anaerolineae bacterium]
FYLDPIWMACLLDGAYSIGRVLQGDLAHDAAQPLDPPADAVTGVLLRSAVVSGFPDFVVDGFAADVSDNTFEPEADALPILRRALLAPDTLLVLFDGNVETVDIHQKPEMLHFGFAEAQDGSLFKERRSLDGDPLPGDLMKADEITWRDADRRILNVTAVAKTLTKHSGTDPVHAAHFTLQMIEGVSKVRFYLTRNPS